MVPFLLFCATGKVLERYDLNLNSYPAFTVILGARRLQRVPLLVSKHLHLLGCQVIGAKNLKFLICVISSWTGELGFFGFNRGLLSGRESFRLEPFTFSCIFV